MREHAEFSFDRQFAGLSPRGMPLSVKGSAGPAAIGAIPLLQEKPEGWQALPHFAHAGVPVLTPNPRLAFFGIHIAGWDNPCTALCIHPNDLATLVEIPDEQSPPLRNDVVIEKFTSALVNQLVQYAQHLKVVLLGNSTSVRVPTSLRLDRSDWAAFNRHLFTGNSSGTLLDTTTIVSGSGGTRGMWRSDIERCFKLVGHSMDEVKARWGVGDTKPCAYDGTQLHFNSLHVLQGAKLSRLHRNAERLEGRHLDVLDPRSSAYSFPLNQALDAGIVPTNGVLHVDPLIETILVPREGLQIGKFKRPLPLRQRWQREEPTLLCPQHLVSQFLIPARQAARTYAIPSNITPFRVRTQNPATLSVGDPPGTYYLLTDLQNLAGRDLKREREARRARHKRLSDRHGRSLPKGHEALSDEQIALYFEIQDLVQAGELIQAVNHPLMPQGYRANVMLNWLQKEAPHLILTCPVTQHSYLRRLESFEELVDIPGFWSAVESAMGERGWLRKLVTCPKVQAAALISSI